MGAWVLINDRWYELYKDPNGRRVLDTDAGPLFSEEVEDGDVQTGMIYVIKSLSDDPRIKEREYLKLCVWRSAHAVKTGHLLNRSG